MQAAPAEYTWAIITITEEAEAQRTREQIGTGPRSPRTLGRGPEAQPRLGTAQSRRLSPPLPRPCSLRAPNRAPPGSARGVQAAPSARCPGCPYRRAAERRARRAGCGPGRLRRGEEQQVGVAGARGAHGGAGGSRRGASVLRGGDDDDLRGVEQPQRAGPEQGLQRRRAWAARGGHGHGAHGPRGPGGRRRRRRGPMAAGRGESSIPLRIPLRPRPPLPAKSRPLLRAKSFLPRKSHEPPSAATIGCPGSDGGDGDGVHWLQRAGPAAEGGTGQRCEEGRPIAERGARRLCRGGARRVRNPRPELGRLLREAWWSDLRFDTPRPARPLETFWAERPVCTSHRLQTLLDPRHLHTHL